MKHGDKVILDKKEVRNCKLAIADELEIMNPLVQETLRKYIAKLRK